MEANPNNASNATKEAVNINREITIKCAIRRKPNLPKGIPGESPLHRTYKLAAGLAKGGRGPVKGITGDVERIIMPQVVNVAPNEPEFYNKVNSYWNEIGVAIPSDEEATTSKEKGKQIEIKALLSDKAKIQFEKASTVEEQFKVLEKAIENKHGFIIPDYIPDFLLLSFAIVRSTVANRFEDISKSARILFYISDTNTSIKQQMSLIELITEANKLFNLVTEDDIKVKSLLTLLKVDLGDLDTKEERIITLHGEYTKPHNVAKFLEYVKDRDILYKYLVTSAINEQKLREQPNTGNIYYNDILIGRSLEEAVLYLKSEEKESREILRTLEGELDIHTNTSQGVK